MYGKRYKRSVEAPEHADRSVLLLILQSRTQNSRKQCNSNADIVHGGY